MNARDEDGWTPLMAAARGGDLSVVRFLLENAVDADATDKHGNPPPSAWTVLIADAVGTIITDRPPHRSVRALLRIRLPPWMRGEKASDGIRMQNARSWNPLREDAGDPIPRSASLAAPA